MTAAQVIRRRAPSEPVHLLDVEVAHGDRTRVRGALWDGVLNASPEDGTDGPSPVEALLAAVGGCFVRNLRWYADGSHVTFDRIGLHFAAERSDEPPAITQVRMEIELDVEADARRVAGIVERALKSGTITRTVARATALTVDVRVNGESVAVRVPDWGDHGPMSGRANAGGRQEDQEDGEVAVKPRRRPTHEPGSLTNP